MILIFLQWHIALLILQSSDWLQRNSVLPQNMFWNSTININLYYFCNSIFTIDLINGLPPPVTRQFYKNFNQILLFFEIVKKYDNSPLDIDFAQSTDSATTKLCPAFSKLDNLMKN